MYIHKNKIHCRKSFRSQISDLWPDAAAMVRAVRQEKESEEKRKSQKRRERVSRQKIKVHEKVEKS